MSQVTIYLEPELAERMRRAAEDEGVSQSKWVAALVEQRLALRWPESVRALAGVWGDFPEAEVLRQGMADNLPRQPL